MTDRPPTELEVRVLAAFLLLLLVVPPVALVVLLPHPDGIVAAAFAAFALWSAADPDGVDRWLSAPVLPPPGTRLYEP